MTSTVNYYDKPWLQFYPKDVPATIVLPERSIPDAFDEASNKYADKVALIFHDNEISYGRLRQQVDQFSKALYELGFKKGEKLALYLLNSPQYIIAYFGALKAGATVTAINPLYTSVEVKHQLEDSEAMSIICQDFFLDNVEKTGLELKNIIVTDIEEYLPRSKKLANWIRRGRNANSEKPSTQIFEKRGYHQFQKLLKKYPTNPPKIEINPKEDVAILAYTGGTTGVSKGVMLTHYNVLACQMQLRAFRPHLKDGKEVIPTMLPLHQVYGQVSVMLNGLLMGAALILFTTSNLDEIIAAMERYRATAFYSLPGAFMILNNHDKTERVDWRRLKIIASGADTLQESTIKAWARRTGARITECFGLTECGAVSHVNPLMKPKTGSFGVPLPNITAAVANPETAEFIAPGEIGELLLTGPNIMKGYWKRGDETKEALVEINGKSWLRTGDLVKMDDEGYFFFYDRKKNIVKYNGYSVYAREIEEALYQHPMVKAAAVLGLPDHSAGQLIKAIVVPQAGARGKVSEEQLIKYCADNLEHYKVPKIVEFRGELPKTDVGKVSHRELREEVEAK
jgi:long-chain acyl-CoA synthetase